MKAFGEPKLPRRHDRRIRKLGPERLDPGDDAGDDGEWPADARAGRARPDGSAGRSAGAAVTGRRPEERDPVDAAIALAMDALDRRARALPPGDLADPMSPTLYRHALRREHRTRWPRLVQRWEAMSGNALDPRTPWSSPDGTTADRLVGAIAWAEALELLAELAVGNGPRAAVADGLHERYVPVVEAVFALHVAADDPRDDLVSLWELTRMPVTLDRLWWLAAAIAFRYATLARRAAGPVLGPDGDHLVSGSAALGSVLWRLRIYPTLVPALIDFVGLEAREGAWGDTAVRTDPLTTLLAADLLASLDPSFDRRPTIGYFVASQALDGTWGGDAPEAPWLTREIAAWLDLARRPFAERFRWPGTLRIDRDRRTGLPTFGYWADLERSVGEVPGLARSDVDLAFIDLAGFGLFNTRRGQAMGDEVIAAFGRLLDTVPAARAIRDGGDEFTVVGVPTDDGLFGRLESFRTEWAAEFRRRFGAEDHVAPRIIVARGRPASELGAAREQLGIRMGILKAEHPTPGPEGVIEWL